MAPKQVQSDHEQIVKSSPGDKIRVMVVDDSAVIRGMLSRVFEEERDIEVVGSAPNGQAAVRDIHEKNPDVIILDVEMPVMDGITALPLLLKEKPDVKILIFSSMTEKGADISVRALSLGAAECLLKPSSSHEISSHERFRENLLQTIRTLAHGKAKESEYASDDVIGPIAGHHLKQKTTKAEDIVLHDDSHSYKGKPDVIAIGSSTGGPQALFKVMRSFRNIDIPILITQHMPPTFTKILAQHITQNCGVECHEGEQNMVIEAGKGYIAPGGHHMEIYRKEGQVLVNITDGPKENFCKPSVDPMMRSIISVYGKRTLGVMLTGMGTDGMSSFQKLVEIGGRVIAQDENTSVVWGMPKAVALAGICSAVLPLDEIGPWVIENIKND